MSLGGPLLEPMDIHPLLKWFHECHAMIYRRGKLIQVEEKKNRDPVVLREWIPRCACKRDMAPVFIELNSSKKRFPDAVRAPGKHKEGKAQGPAVLRRDGGI